MATTDEKLDAILLMQAEILGRLQALDPARDTPSEEDPRVTALQDLEASIKYQDEKTPPLIANIESFLSELRDHGRSSS